MRRSDGRYDYSMNCADGSGCQKTALSFTQTGAWVVLAYDGLYTATSNLKTTTDTGYMIYLLSQIPNERFEIIPWR